jgi:hypothetical protein
VAGVFDRLSAAFAARLRGLGVGSADPPADVIDAILESTRLESAGPESASAPTCAFELPEALAVPLQDYLKAYPGPGHTFPNAPVLTQCEAGRRLLSLAPADRVRIAVAAYQAWSSAPHGGAYGGALQRVISDLLRSKLPLTDADAIALLETARRGGFVFGGFSPNAAVLRTLERHVAARGMSADLQQALERLLAEMTRRREGNLEGDRLRSGIERLLTYGEKGASTAVFKPNRDAWGNAVLAKLASLPPDERAELEALLALATGGGKKAKPSDDWLASARRALGSSNRVETGQHLIDFIEGHAPGADIGPENRETVRGLVWLAVLAAPELADRRLEACAHGCLTTSDIPPAHLSRVLGTASIHAFALMPGTSGVGSLSRLRQRLRRPGDIKLIDKALNAIAHACGLPASELEEIGLPDYGLAPDGTLEIAVGPATAVLAISDASSVRTTWRGADGKPLRGPPAAVKSSHAEALKQVTARAKEIEDTLKAQRARLERIYLDDREWSLDVWSARYLHEPLVAPLAHRLIWSFRLGERWVAGLPRADGVFDAAATRLDLAAPDIRVKLWHPMQSEASHVLAWRHCLAQLSITQPFKQAHREVYILTDAERANRTYSNRFAAHILQRHQFRALCQARGWSCPGYGSWDPGNERASKHLQRKNLLVEFRAEPIEESLDQEGYLFTLLTTDQVRFADSVGEISALERVPPILFSELMRDVDLFVSVAGIANDPTWQDRGADAYGEYWTATTFGPLSEIAKTRHAVLKDLLPGLAIADQCRLEDRFLVVTGKLHTYRIHLGSSNIRMEPIGRRLCIVIDKRTAGPRVPLPFEGDIMLLVILSKAFLLADDDRIKDPSILSQFRMK